MWGSIHCAHALLQVGRACSKSTPKPMTELPSAASLVAAIQHHKQRVMETYAQEGMSAKLARSLHDLALLCTIFGHLPPLRLSCIRSLMVPAYSGPCLNPDCKLGDTCNGNQLKPTPQHGLHMHLPHHKNENRWKRASISFDVPQELAELLKLHVSKGWEILTIYNGAEDACHVFVDGKGHPFTSSNFTMYWNKLVHAMGLPAFSPSQCRQIFVTERRSDVKVSGPNERGAAMVMGHSVAQWDKWYDLTFHARQAQEAVNAMTSWRVAMLASMQPQQQASSAQQPHKLPCDEPQPHPLAALLHGSAASPSATVPPSSLAMPMVLDEEDILVDID